MKDKNSELIPEAAPECPQEFLSRFERHGFESARVPSESDCDVDGSEEDLQNVLEEERKGVVVRGRRGWFVYCCRTREEFQMCKSDENVTEGCCVLFRTSGYNAEITKILNFNGEDICSYFDQDSSSGLPLFKTVHAIISGNRDPLDVRRSLAQIGRLLHVPEMDNILPPLTITQDKLQGRKDLTRELVFTIDGAETKDMDDAVSLNKTETGIVVLSIHISDVAAHVTPGSAHDDLAKKRASSLYLGPEVYNMIGDQAMEVLSLEPGQDRLAVTVSIPISTDGTCGTPKIFRSIVKNQCKLSYDVVDKVLKGEEVQEQQVYGNYTWEKVRETLVLLDGVVDLAEKLHDATSSRVHFSSTDLKFKFGTDGKVLDAICTEYSRSMDLIEFLMVLTNISVGKVLKDKWEELNSFYCEQSFGFERNAESTSFTPPEPLPLPMRSFTPLFCGQRIKRWEGHSYFDTTFFDDNLKDLRMLNIDIGKNTSSAMKFLEETSDVEKRMFVGSVLSGSFQGAEVELGHPSQNEYQGTSHNLIVHRQLLFAMNWEMSSNCEDLPDIDVLSARMKGLKTLENSFNSAAFGEWFKGRTFEGVVVSIDPLQVSILKLRMKRKLEGTAKWNALIGNVFDVNVGWKDEKVCLVAASNKVKRTIGTRDSSFGLSPSETHFEFGGIGFRNARG